MFYGDVMDLKKLETFIYVAEQSSFTKAADDTSDAGVTIRIAMADSLCHFIFWNNFSSFNKQYPNIRLEIILTNTQEMFRLAKQNNVDLVFTLDT